MARILQQLKANTIESWDLKSGSFKGETGTHDLTPSSAPMFSREGLALDGVDDYALVADHADFSFGDGSTDSAFSISAWVKMDSVSAFSMTSKGVYNTNAEYAFVMSTGNLTFVLYDESVASCYIGRYYNSSLASYEGEWIHVAVTYDGTGYNAGAYGISVYINGVAVDDADFHGNQASYVAMENLAGEFRVGRVSTDYANGTFGHVAIFDKELSATEVSQIHGELANRKWPNKKKEIAIKNVGANTDDASLVAAWSMRPVN